MVCRSGYFRVLGEGNLHGEAHKRADMAYLPRFIGLPSSTWTLLFDDVCCYYVSFSLTP